METADRQKYPTTFDLADAYREMLLAMAEDLRQEAVVRRHMSGPVDDADAANLDQCMLAVQLVVHAVDRLERVSR